MHSSSNRHCATCVGDAGLDLRGVLPRGAVGRDLVERVGHVGDVSAVLVLVLGGRLVVEVHTSSNFESSEARPKRECASVSTILA